MAYNRVCRVIVTPVKFGTNEPTGSSIIITSPITIKFNINRMPFGGQTNASIDIYNLNPDTREKLFYDWFDFENVRQVIVEAGYENEKYDIIYKGRIRFCSTSHQGTNNITHIEADSMLGVLDNLASISLKAGESVEDLVGRVINSTPALEEGEVSVPEYVVKRPVALIGNAIALLKTYTKDNVAVDLDEIVIIDRDEVIKGDVRVIDDETGLLGIPERQRTSLTVRCIFEPRIKIGQGLEIKSRILPVFDGQYKVWGVSHNGTIGGTQGGECTTTIILWTGLNLFGRFKSSWENVKNKYSDVQT